MPCNDDNDSEEFTNDETLPLKMRRLIDQENKQILPKEVTKVINLENNGEKKEVKIGTTLSEKIKKEIIVEHYHEFTNVFAWSYQDMLGLSTKIVEHCLPLKLECKPIQQKLRKMKPENQLKIKKVKKQFDAGFLEIA